MFKAGLWSSGAFSLFELVAEDKKSESLYFITTEYWEND
jgi:hypothetical protein